MLQRHHGQPVPAEYLAGQRFTIADITAFCGLEFARGLMKFKLAEAGLPTSLADAMAGLTCPWLGLYSREGDDDASVTDVYHSFLQLMMQLNRLPLPGAAVRKRLPGDTRAADRLQRDLRTGGNVEHRAQDFQPRRRLVERQMGTAGEIAFAAPDAG